MLPIGARNLGDLAGLKEHALQALSRCWQTILEAGFSPRDEELVERPPALGSFREPLSQEKAPFNRKSGSSKLLEPVPTTSKGAAASRQAAAPERSLGHALE